MLVLTRKSEQKIYIGKDIIITILKIHGDQVSVGITAPKTMPIYREELLGEVKKENREGVLSPEHVDLKKVAHSIKFKPK